VSKDRRGFAAKTNLGLLFQRFARGRAPWIRGSLLAAVAALSAGSLLAASAPAANGIFSFDRLRLGGAGGTETYVFTAGNVIYPEGGVDTGRFYRFVVTDAGGVTRNTPVCRPESQFNSANNTYTIGANDPLSGSAGWRYTLNQYTSSTCTGAASKTANKTFYVAQATAYADSALTVPRSTFRAGETAFVLVRGLRPSSSNWSSTWILPSGAIACANTAGNDRADSSSSGVLPTTFLQYRPNTTNIGSNWNRESNYETRPCVNFAVGNEGAWRLRMELNATTAVDLPVFSVDATAPPTPSIGSGPPDPSGVSTATFTFSDSESGVSFVCRLDAASFAACSTPASYSGLPDGAHTFQVKARDTVGNESPVASYPWTVDTGPPPAPTIDTHPSDPSNSPNATFGFTGEAGATFRCQLDGSTFATCASPVGYVSLTEGQHSFSVKAVDVLGHESTVTSFVWTIDLTPPAAPSIDSHPPNPTDSSTATFVFSGEPGASFKCRIDGAAFGSCTSPTTYTGLADGTQSFDVKARDTAGNESSAASYSWLINAPPVVTLIQPAHGSSTNDATPLFTGTGGTDVGDDPHLTVKIYEGAGVNGSLVETLATLVDFTGAYSVEAVTALPDGTYTARGEQSDAFATGYSSANTFVIDSTPPATPSIDSHPPTLSNSSNATFAFSGEPAATFRCRLDGAAFGACTSPVVYSGLADNAHTFEVNARDAAGNESAATSFAWTVDTSAPAVTLTTPTNGATTSDTTPTFSGAGGTAAGDASSVTVKVYSGADTNGTLVQTLTANLSGGSYSIDASPALAEGTYTARSQQADSAGNTGFSSANTFTIATTGSAYRAEILADDPASYWRLGETSGTTENDERAANTGTYVNGVLLGQPGTILNDTNKAVALDGVNDYVSVPDSNSLDMTAGVTLETWMKRTKSAAYQVIASKPGNGQSKLENYALWLNTSNQIVAYFGNGTTYVSVTGGTIDTAWHHVAASYDNATAKIYVDGILRASATSTVALTPNSLPLNVGRSNDNSYFYGGLLDELAVYPRALSPTRLRAHYETGLGIDTTPPDVSLTAPPNGGSTNDTTPALSGTAGSAPGDSNTVTLKVYAGGTPTGTPLQILTAARQGNGAYTIDAAALAAGTYTAQAEQLDVAGNRGVSSPATFTIDTTVPVVTLTQPANSSVTGTMPTFRGVAGAIAGDTASVTVEVWVGPAPSGSPVMTLTAPREPNNSYSVLADIVLLAGTYTARTNQTDAAGNTGFSTVNTFTVSTADFDPPNVTLVAPADGSSTQDTTPTLSGQAGTAPGDLPGITVRIYQGSGTGGTLVETLTTTAAGSTWSVDAAPPLANGVYTAQAEQSDTAGNAGHSSANVFTVGTSYRDEVLADGPRAYWRLGETTGTTAADQTGSNPGSYGGSFSLGQPGALSADPNSSVSFNGTSGFMTAPDSTSLDLTNGATVEFWIKRSQSAPYQVVVGKPGDGQSKNENYAVWLNSDVPVAYFGNGSNYASVFGTTPLDTDWHYFVATYDNSTARIYVDGVLDASSTSTVHLTGNSLPFNAARGQGGQYFFGGQLDEIALYPTALSAARIQTHFSKANPFDTTPPNVTLTTPENGSATVDTTPALAGSAAITSTDSATVTVKVYSGPSPTGTPIRTMTTPHGSTGVWSTSASPALPLGTYTGQAEQSDTSGNVGLSAPQTFTIGTRQPVGSDQEFIGAGDIAYCDDTGDEATAALLDQFPSSIVFTLGDNAYESGTLSEFNNCYQPTWGRAKARTRPTLGDHDYADGGSPNAPGYMTYFQQQLAPFGASATDPNRGYYSYDLGTWHVIAVNAVCGGAASGCNRAAEITWIQNDLAAHPNACTVALVSAPRYSSGSVHGNNADVQDFWSTLASGGVDLYLSGDDHDYERFAPMNAQGAYFEQGMREIIVGTGGRSHYPFSNTVVLNSETRNDATYGILRLVLRPGGYEWEFVPEAGASFIDSGSSTCH
jgi:large repetitive protein